MRSSDARQVIDITTPLDAQTPAYPGDRRFARQVVADMRRGDGYNLSALSMSAHSGTHLDAPRHFLSDGTPIDGIDPARFVSDALLVDFNGRESVGEAELAELPLHRGASLLLCANSGRLAHVQDGHACTLREDGARYLVQLGIGLVGIDALSIEADGDADYPVHHLLLGGDVLICEGLRLAGVDAGWYTLILAPLAISDGDGAPARALLLR